MKFCSKCGAQIEDDSRFCGVCGAETVEAPAYAAQNQSQNTANQQPISQPNQNNYYQQQNNGGQQVPPTGAAGVPPYGAQGQGNGFVNFLKKLLFGTTEYQMDPQDIAANKAVSIISCFGILFFVPLCANSNSTYNRFKANQSLWVLIVSAGLGIVCAILTAIVNVIFPGSWEGSWYYGYSYKPNVFAVIFNVIFYLATYVPALTLFIMNLVYAVNGRAKELPIVGKIRIIK